MNKSVPKDDDKFLTTAPSWNLEALITNLPNHPIPTCVIHIEPLIGKTGLLEERGQWIKDFWETIIGDGKSFEGHRSSWNELIFFSPSTELNKFIQTVSYQLKSLTVNQLKSLAIFSVISGSFEEQISEIEKMNLQLSKIDYWEKHKYSSYFENGIEIKLTT